MAVASHKRGADQQRYGRDQRKKQRLQQDELCVACREIDFLAYYSSELREKADIRDVCDFDQAEQNGACPFCRLLVRLAGESWRCRKTGQFRIDSHLLQGRLKSKDAGVSRYCLEVHWGRGSPLTTARLDIVGQRTRCMDRGNSSHIMKRRLVQPKCDLSLFKDWLATCERSHGHNTDDGPDQLILKNLYGRGYFRVIDVNAKTIITLDQYQSFVALSYVWGKSMAKTAARNYASSPDSRDKSRQGLRYTRELDYASLPQTIKDAMDVVQGLGKRYLWVDAICVNQCDAGEKSEVISAMSSVYENADLTIVAAAGSDADAGLPGLHTGSRVAETETVFDTHGSSLSLLSHSPALHQVLNRSVWGSRGWTYQERMLSRKCLYFTEAEVFYTCGTVTWREAYDVEVGPGLPPASVHETGLLHRSLAGVSELGVRDFSEALEEYTKRDLTYAGDRLAAFGGILSKFSTPHGSAVDPSLQSHGMPMHFFEAALQWKPGRKGTERPLKKSDRILKEANNGRTSPMFPSWSWAGWKGLVHLFAKRSAKPMMKYEMLDEHNIFGRPNGEQYTLFDLTKHRISMTVDDHALFARGIANGHPMTLHLWTFCFHSRLVLKSDRRTTGWTYEIPSAVYITSHLEIEAQYFNSHGSEHLYEFIFVGAAYDLYTMMLIEWHGDYAERVGIVSMRESDVQRAIEATGSNTHWKYVKLR